jgi:23S rRNA pseudouridine1911/1915/1917 synthase
LTEEKTVFNYTYTGEDGLRLDQFVTNQFTDESRTTIKKWIKDKLVTVNGKVAKASQALVNGDLVGVEKPTPAEAEEFKPVAEKMALDIVFEDDDILVRGQRNFGLFELTARSRKFYDRDKSVG